MALPPPGKPQRIRDPLHDLIEFGTGRFEQMLWKVIQSRPFQRLRRVRQLGFSEFVFPGATHTRFAHSIGVFHNARRLMEIIRRHVGEDNFDRNRAEAALAASLVHDVGHGPFSHSFEVVGKSMQLTYARHEYVSEAIIRETDIARILNDYDNGLAEKVANIIAASHPADVYSAVVSSQFDADRLDYMQRDRLMTGTQHSAIDLTWLMANLEVARVPFGVDDQQVGEIETFVLGQKAFFAAQTYVVGLFQLYPTVYFHKTTRAAEKVFQDLFARLVYLVQNDSVAKTGLSSTNPLVVFAKSPDLLENALNLDDTVVLGSLSEMCSAEDPAVSNLAKALRDRSLPKAVDARSVVREKLPASCEDVAVEKAVSLAIGRLREVCKENHDYQNRIWIDHAERTPYKEYKEDTGKLNQILIHWDGDLVDLQDVSPVVSAVEPFRLDRAYYFSDDHEARKVINDAVDDALREAKKQ